MRYEEKMDKNKLLIENMILYLKRGIEHNPNVALRSYWSVIEKDFKNTIGSVMFSLESSWGIVESSTILKIQYVGFWVCGKFYCYTTTVKELHDDLIKDSLLMSDSNESIASIRQNRFKDCVFKLDHTYSKEIK